MPQDEKPFGRRRTPIAEFKSVDEEYKKGQLSRRQERRLTICLTPLVFLAVFLLSPESRAFAVELGAKVFSLGKDWLLRGLLS